MLRLSNRVGLAIVFIASLVCTIPAQAQFNFNPLQIIGSGGRLNPRGAIGVGVGALQEVSRQQQASERRRQRAIAAEEARQRRIELARSRAGRAQLAREDRAARQRERAQQQLILGIAGAMLSGGGSGGGGNDDYDKRRQERNEQIQRMQIQQDRDMRKYYNSPY